MAEELQMRPSEFADTGAAGFGITYVADGNVPPTVGVATVDFRTDEEAVHDLRPGQPFQVAGQTWQFAEIRYPADTEWEVILRRLDA